MRLLLDQGLPRSAAELLCLAEHDAVHTGDSGLATAEDAAVLELARKHGRIVITLDSDFHALMALAGASMPSVVRIRREGLRAEAVADLVRRVVDRYQEELAAGALVTVTRSRIRIRGLPITPSSSAG